MLDKSLNAVLMTTAKPTIETSQRFPWDSDDPSFNSGNNIPADKTVFITLSGMFIQTLSGQNLTTL